MDFTVVTAWYDVREKENHPLKNNDNNGFFCTISEYFDKNKLFLNKPFPMVIYTEPRFEAMIKEARPIEFHSMTRFIFKDYDELPFYRYFKQFEENHTQNPVINLDINKFTPLYKFIVNQKTNFVKEVAEMNPFNTSRFAWMDLRLHAVYDLSPEETATAISSIQSNKVRMMFMSYLPTYHICGRYDFYSWTRGKVAAGFFAGEAAPIIEFARLCQKELISAIEENMSPSDEMVYSYVAANNTHLFEPYVGEYIDCLRNMPMARRSNYLIIPFFDASVEVQNHPYVADLFENIRSGYINHQIELPEQDIIKIWYYACVANYALNRPDKCYQILHEFIGLHAQTPIPIQTHSNFRELSAALGHIDLVVSMDSLDTSV